MAIPPESTADDTLELVGEAVVLERIFPRLPEASAALVGPGDDCAVVAAPDARFVVTTDMMVHGPDFRMAWSRPHDLGWKAAASNLADVAAMGAVPTALVVAIAAPASSPLSLLEGIADGFRDACAALAAALRRDRPRLIDAQLAPRPPIADGRLAALAGASAMIDLSDGLAIDARRLAAASGVCVDLDSSALGEDPGSALAGGEDHSLLATFPPGAVPPPGFVAIGTVRSGRGLALDGEPNVGGGWDPYTGWDAEAG
jgi:thiamine monophosphate kinase